MGTKFSDLKVGMGCTVKLTQQTWIVNKHVEPGCTEDGKRIKAISVCGICFQNLVQVLGKSKLVRTRNVRPILCKHGEKVLILFTCVQHNKSTMSIHGKHKLFVPSMPCSSLAIHACVPHLSRTYSIAIQYSGPVKFR